MKRATQEEKSAIVEAYLGGANAKEAAAFFGFSKMVALTELKKRGLTRSPYSMEYRKSPFDETFFECIDTEEKAYFLGFWAADGWVTGNYVGIGLQALDIAIIERFAECIGYAGNIQVRSKSSLAPNKVTRHTSLMATLQLGSKKMVADLVRHGISHRKTFTVSPWVAPAGRDDLQRAYWRGCVDGDGTLGKIAGGYQIVLAGNLAMVEGFLSFCAALTHSTCKPVKNGSIWAGTIGGKYMAAQVARALYEDAAIFLPRKKALADEILGQGYERHFAKSLSLETIIAEYEAGASTDKIAAKYDLAPCSIRERLRRAGFKLRSNSEAKRLLASQGVKSQSGLEAAGVSDIEIRELYDAGATLAQIARQFKTSPPLVRKCVIEAGGTLRASGAPKRAAL